MNIATEPTKIDLENRATELLSEKLGSPIATKKYLTSDNRLVYISIVGSSAPTIPSLRIQVFERVEGGVHETIYALFSDRRFEKTQNAMIFGRSATPVSPDAEPVDEPTATGLLELLDSLTPDQQTL